MSEEKKLEKTLNTGNLELINEFFEESKNSDAIHALMIIDLDNFKSVNDCAILKCSNSYSSLIYAF